MPLSLVRVGTRTGSPNDAMETVELSCNFGRNGCADELRHRSLNEETDFSEKSARF